MISRLCLVKSLTVWMQRMDWALVPDPELAPRLKRFQEEVFLQPTPLPAAPFLPHTNCGLRFYLSPNQVCNVNINPNPRHQLSLLQDAQPWPGWKTSPGRIIFMSYPFLAALGSSTPSASLGTMTLILLIECLSLSPFLSLGWVLAQGTQPWPRWEIYQWKLYLQTIHPFSSYLLTLPRMVILVSGIFCCCCSLLPEKYWVYNLVFSVNYVLSSP